MASPARRILRSFGYAFEGLGTLLRTQPNFALHLVAAAGVLALSVALGLPPTELAVLALTIGVVLTTEAFNTALEALGDVASPSFHPLVKRAKDVAAAAVLIAALAALGVGVALLGPRLLALR